MTDFVKAVTDQLKTYLTSQLSGSGITISAEWPMSNREMVVPALTIVTGQPKFVRCPPYFLSRTDPVGESASVTSTYCMGTYAVPLQLDLWCRYPIQRSTLYQSVFNALQPVDPGGLVLTLTGYYNQRSTYEYLGYSLLDNEESASRQEFRARFDLEANCLAVKTSTDYIILETGLDFATPDIIEE